MPRNFKQARQLNKLKAIEAADKLGVSQPTLSAWEGERKSPSVESLEKMADLYGVTTDYLLCRDTGLVPIPEQPITQQMLMILNGKPVWSAKHGWLLVNVTEKHLISSNGQTLPFEEADQLYIAPPLFSEPKYPKGKPLSRAELGEHSNIWVEPISRDTDLRNELRGWYHVRTHFVENEYGNRLYLDTYASKWLAFQKEI